MNDQDQQEERSQREPGAGGGLAGNPPAKEMEGEAVKKVAGHPGGADNAAGMGNGGTQNNGADSGSEQ